MNNRPASRTCVVLTALLASACVPHIDRGPVAAELAAAPARVVTLSPEPAGSLHLVTWMRAGSVFDPPGQEGLAAMVAYAAAGPSLQERANALGASLTVAVERDAVGFFLSCPHTRAGACLDLWATLLSPEATDTAWTGARHLAEARLRRLRVGSARRGDALLDALVFEGHRYGHAPTGRFGALPALHPSDGARFRAAHWVRQSSVTGLAGSWRAEDRATVEEHLAALPGQLPVRPTAFGPRHRAGRELLVVPEAEQAWIHLGHALPSRTGARERFLLGLGLSVLAERVPSLEVSEGVEREQPRWAVQIGPLPQVNPQGLGSTLQALDALVADGVTPGELARLRASSRRILAAAQADPAAAILDTARRELLERPPLHDVQRWLGEATPEEIHAVLAAQIRPDAVKMVVSGPGAEELALEGATLGIDSVWQLPAERWFH